MFILKKKSIIKKLTVLCILFAIVFSSNIFTRENIATVNLQQILSESTQCKLAQYTIKKQILARENILEKKENIIKQMIKDYEEKKSKIPEKSLKELEKKIIHQREELQNLAMSFERSLSIEEYKKNQEILSKIKSITENIASEKKIDIVIPKSSLLYKKEKLDITEDILKKLN